VSRYGLGHRVALSVIRSEARRHRDDPWYGFRFLAAMAYVMGLGAVGLARMFFWVAVIGFPLWGLWLLVRYGWPLLLVALVVWLAKGRPPLVNPTIARVEALSQWWKRATARPRQPDPHYWGRSTPPQPDERVRLYATPDQPTLCALCAAEARGERPPSPIPCPRCDCSRCGKGVIA
jgi:hypothetical protein